MAWAGTAEHISDATVYCAKGTHSKLLLFTVFFFLVTATLYICRHIESVGGSVSRLSPRRCFGGFSSSVKSANRIGIAPGIFLS